MRDKIVLEEHFAFGALLEELPPAWAEVKRRLGDFHGERLRDMDAHGIERAVLGLNTPAAQALPRLADAEALAQRANDLLAEEIAKRPDRLAGFAALPMQDPERAAKELARCIAQLGFRGAMVNGFSDVEDARRALYYDDASFEPFWRVVEELDVPFYLHPRQPLLAHQPIFAGHPWLAGPAWGFGFEAATHALRLMACGLFDRHPRLKLILGHLGEGLPFNIWRIDNRLAKHPVKSPMKRKIADYFAENVWLTTSGIFRTPPLLATLAEVGAARVMFSVDYPFEENSEATAWFDGLPLSDADKRKIGRLNAAALLRL